MAIIRNKLKIIPNAYSEEDYEKQINSVANYCSAMEDGIKKEICFTKISPKPVGFECGSKEEDDWLLKNWGTRFKALNTCWINDDEMIFDTIWNPALPIILKIAKEFPNTDFEFKFASKKTGKKTGKLIASEGKIILFNKFEDYTKEAYEMAFELMPHLKMLYTLNQKSNTYDYDVSDFEAQIKQKGFYREDDGTALIGALYDKNKPLFDSIDDLPF